MDVWFTMVRWLSVPMDFCCGRRRRLSDSELFVLLQGLVEGAAGSLVAAAVEHAASPCIGPRRPACDPYGPEFVEVSSTLPCLSSATRIAFQRMPSLFEKAELCALLSLVAFWPYRRGASQRHELFNLNVKFSSTENPNTHIVLGECPRTKLDPCSISDTK